MIFSPFLLSVAMWGLAGIALWESAANAVSAGKAAYIRSVVAWKEGLRLAFLRYTQYPALWLLSLLFIVPAISYFWSLDTSYWWVRTRVRIPFFVLPWAFANLPRLTERQQYLVLYILVWVMVLFCIGVGINYMLDYENILEGLAQGHPIPVPRHHIRFNLILVTTILSGGWLWARRFVWRYPWERTALTGAVLFLFAFLHVLTVRSGMAALYVALFYTICRFIWRTRRWKLGLAAIVIIASIPIVALKTIPSLQTRIQYMLHDWEQYKLDTGDDYSDAERWVSLTAGMQLWRESPMAGVGAGDLPMEIQRVVNDRFPRYTIEPKLPHNQFIYILAGTGLLGLLLSLLAWFVPIFEGNNRGFYLFAAFQFIIFVSFLVEYTLETSIGVTFYLFYLLWFRNIAIFKITKS
jgi:O-antigen ligase